MHMVKTDATALRPQEPALGHLFPTQAPPGGKNPSFRGVGPQRQVDPQTILDKYQIHRASPQRSVMPDGRRHDARHQ